MSVERPVLHRFRIRLLTVVSLLIALTCLAALPAIAQTDGPAIDEATLRIAPEYDDPGTLVILYGTFGGITTYPQKVTFQVPAAARDLQTTELDKDQGTLLMRPAERQGDQVSYNLEKQPGFQIEYYLDRQPGGSDRTVQFNWRAPYAIKSLTVQAQQPARSTGFSLTPKQDSSYPASDGLTLYEFKRSNVAAGEDLNVTMRYSKADSAPSFSRPAASASSANEPATSAPAVPAVANTSNVIAWALIGLGVLALAAALIYFLLERRRGPAPAVPAGRPARQPQVAGVGDGESRFCPKCGRPYSPGDRFCGSCGMPRS